MTPAAQREILGNMGITPLVLRSRELPELGPVPGPGTLPGTDSGVSTGVTPPDAVQPAPTPEAPVVSAVELIAPETPADKVDTAPEPQSTQQVSDPLAEPLYFAVVSCGNLIVVAQLPSWTQGLIERNTQGLLSDIALYLSQAGPVGEVLSLPKSVPATRSNYQGLLQGRLLRARSQGATRLLILAENSPELTAELDSQWGVYTGPSLHQIMEDKTHKQSLWALIQRVNQ